MSLPLIAALLAALGITLAFRLNAAPRVLTLAAAVNVACLVGGSALTLWPALVLHGALLPQSLWCLALRRHGWRQRRQEAAPPLAPLRRPASAVRRSRPTRNSLPESRRR